MGEQTAARKALNRLLGKKAEQGALDPNKSQEALLAKARLEQLQAGVTPTRGRGSCGGETPLPEGKGWRPHVGSRQRSRNLCRTWEQFEARCAGDEWYRTTRERLLDAVVDDPHPEYAAMHIALGAKVASDEKKEWLRRNPPPLNAPPMVQGSEWVDALNVALNHFEEVADRTKANAAESGAAL